MWWWSWLFGPEFWWLWKRPPKPLPEPPKPSTADDEEVLIAIIRWMQAGGERWDAPDLRHLSRERVERLMRMSRAAVRLAPVLYQAWRIVYDIKPVWQTLSQSHQQLWIERAGRFLIHLPAVMAPRPLPWRRP